MYSKAENILASQQFNQINVSSLSSGYQQFHMIASSFFRHFTNQTIYWHILHKTVRTIMSLVKTPTIPRSYNLVQIWRVSQISNCYHWWFSVNNFLCYILHIRDSCPVNFVTNLLRGYYLSCQQSLQMNIYLQCYCVTRFLHFLGWGGGWGKRCWSRNQDLLND